MDSLQETIRSSAGHAADIKKNVVSGDLFEKIVAKKKSKIASLKASVEREITASQNMKQQHWRELSELQKQIEGQNGELAALRSEVTFKTREIEEQHLAKSKIEEEKEKQVSRISSPMFGATSLAEETRESIMKKVEGKVDVIFAQMFGSIINEESNTNNGQKEMSVVDKIDLISQRLSQTKKDSSSFTIAVSNIILASKRLSSEPLNCALLEKTTKLSSRHQPIHQFDNLVLAVQQIILNELETVLVPATHQKVEEKIISADPWYKLIEILEQLSASQEKELEQLIESNMRNSHHGKKNRGVSNTIDYCVLIARNWLSFLKEIISVLDLLPSLMSLDVDLALTPLKTYDILSVLRVYCGSISQNNSIQQDSMNMSFPSRDHAFANTTGTLSPHSLSPLSHSPQSSKHSNMHTNTLGFLRTIVKISDKYSAKLDDKVVKSSNFSQVLLETNVILQVLEENLANSLSRLISGCKGLRNSIQLHNGNLSSALICLIIQHSEDELTNIRNALKLLDLSHLCKQKLRKASIKEASERNNSAIFKIIQKITEMKNRKSMLNAAVFDGRSIENTDRILQTIGDIYSESSLSFDYSTSNPRSNDINAQIYETIRENAGYKLAMNQVYMHSIHQQ